jgi:hypothetical protein
MPPSSVGMFWKSMCPACMTVEHVYIYDEGISLVYRLLLGNNRFACRQCKVTWRRRDPHDYFEMDREPKWHNGPPPPS